MPKKDYSLLQNGSDVRGIATDGVQGETVNLTKEAAEDIAAAFTVWLKEKTGKDQVRISVGHDSRISAPTLLQGVVDGITKTGNDAEITYLSSTPSMFMLLQDENRRSDGSVMITASHLPFNRNGLKFFTKEGGLESKDIKALLSLAENGVACADEKGKVEEKPYLDEYAASLVQFVRTSCGKDKPLSGKKILVDAGNGAGGFYAEKVLVPLGANVDGSQFLEPDGTFPNHVPNPENKEAMRSVCEAVKKAKADFGIIFDTDVDRAGAVDENGEEINRNRLIALISSILLKEKAGTIVTDSVTSDGLTEFIQAKGGKHHRFKRGYKNVINEAIRLNNEGEYTPLAIETSGHAALKENYFLDDGAYLITRLLIALAKEGEQGRSLTAVLKDLPEAKEADEVRFKFHSGVDFKTLGNQIIASLKSYASTLPYIRLAEKDYEGVRLNFDKDHGNGWLLVRLSLHDPILPTNAESASVGGVQTIFAWLREFLTRFDGLDVSAAAKYIDNTPKKTNE